MQEMTMTITDELSFQYGPGCKTFEQQANEQGYTLARHGDFLQKLGDALGLLHSNQVLSNAQYKAAVKRLNRQVVSFIRPRNTGATGV